MSSREIEDKSSFEKNIDKPVKILHVAATTTGGIGLLLLYLAKHIDKKKFDVTVAFGPGYILDKEFFKERITVYTISTSRKIAPFSIVKGFFQIYRLIKEKRFDIVHSHTSVGGLIGRVAGKLAGVPVVIWSIHGFASHEGQNRFKKYIFLLIEKVLDKFTDHYVAVSEALKKEGIQNRILTSNKVTVIHNGIELRNYNKNFNVIQKKKELGIEMSRTIIGTVTRFEPQKAIHDFLVAVSYVKKIYPDIKVVIAGDGPLRREIEKLINDLKLNDNITLLGWRNDVPEILAVLDIFCQSSLWEGCPMVLLEAMAVGKPIIATNVGGVKEIVEDDNTGILVPPADPKAMADAIVKLINNKEKAIEMGMSGRRRVESFFNMDSMLAQYEKLYQDLLKRFN
jgi:glycosyltransferase involved in cell wall biosynthesis